MHDQVPRPRAIARRMISVCEKLMNGGDTALLVAKGQDSPLRARRYDAGVRVRGSKHPEDDPGYNDQTGAVACARQERKQPRNFDNFVGALRSLDSSLTRVDSVYEKIMGKAKRHEHERRNRLPGSGRCVACNDWMPGGEDRDHRIVNGFCPRHNKGYHRAKRNGETRSDYIARIRRNRGVDSEDPIEEPL